MSNERVAKRTGEALGDLAQGWSFSGGVNSPNPEDAGGTIPSLNAVLASDDPMALVAETGIPAVMEGNFDAGNGSRAEWRYEGYLNSVRPSRKGTVSVSVDGEASMLNQEITTLPIVPTNVYGEAKDILRNTAFHWFMECGLFRWQHPGRMIMQVNNLAYGIGYLQSSTGRRLVAAKNVTSGQDNETVWRSTSDSYGEGYRPEQGKTLRFVMVYSGYTDTTPEQFGEVYFSSSFPYAGDVSAKASLAVSYDVTTGTAKADLYRNGALQKNILTISGMPSGAAVSQNVFVELTATPNASGTYDWALSALSENTVYNAGPVTYTDPVIPVDRLIITQVVTSSIAGLDLQPLDSFYIVESDETIMTDPYAMNLYTIASPNASNVGETVIPGVKGNCWQMFNELCSVLGMVFDPSQFIVYEGYGQYDLDNDSHGITRAEMIPYATSRELSETVEVVNQNYKGSGYYITGLPRMVEMWRADSVYTIDKGEKQVHLIQTDHTFTELEQPQVTWPSWLPVAAEGEATSSLYCVYGDDKNPISPDEWTFSGGSIKVTPTGNPGEFEMVIQAPSEEMTFAAPYHISIETSMPSLRIVGAGVRKDPETITAYTGAGAVLRKVGTTYESPFIGNSTIAWNVANRLAQVHGTPDLRATGEMIQYSADSEGNVPQDRFWIRKGGQVYRAINTTYDAHRTRIGEAVKAVRVGDMDAEFEGLTCGEVDDIHANKTNRQHDYAPLRSSID